MNWAKGNPTDCLRMRMLILREIWESHPRIEIDMAQAATLVIELERVRQAIGNKRIICRRIYLAFPLIF